MNYKGLTDKHLQELAALGHPFDYQGIDQSGLATIEMAGWDEGDREPTSEEAKLAKICMTIAIVCWTGLLLLALLIGTAKAGEPMIGNRCISIEQVTHAVTVHQALAVVKFNAEQAVIMLAYLVQATGEDGSTYQVPNAAIAVAWDGVIEVGFFNVHNCQLPQVMEMSGEEYKKMIDVLSGPSA